MKLKIEEKNVVKIMKSSILTILISITMILSGCASTGKNVGKQLNQITNGRSCKWNAYQKENFRWWGGSVKMDYNPVTSDGITTINADMVIDKDELSKYTHHKKMGAKIVDLYGWVTLYFMDENCTIQHSYTSYIKNDIKFAIPDGDYGYVHPVVNMQYKWY